MNVSEIKVAVTEAKVENVFIEKNRKMENEEQPKMEKCGENITNL